jgi:hypothetical protein
MCVSLSVRLLRLYWTSLFGEDDDARLARLKLVEDEGVRVLRLWLLVVVV